MALKNLRSRFERFCLRNQRKGIPNLMLYVTVGSAIVYLISQFTQSSTLYSVLEFNRSLILQGQVWRLFSYVFTGTSGNFVLALISLYCYYSLGRAVEARWGTFRFNLFYFTGIILMDVFAMIFASPSFMLFWSDGVPVLFPADTYYTGMVTWLNLSLLIAFSTLYPDTHFLFFFIIPVKAWIFALIYLGLILFNVWNLSYPVFCFPHNLFPLIALANYFLFFGKDVANLIPLSWRVKARRTGGFHKPQPKTGPIPFHSGQKAQTQAPYHHRCTVCGRTDVSNPELEFRYCSKCNGYYCYCANHINNHVHIQ